MYKLVYAGKTSATILKVFCVLISIFGAGIAIYFANTSSIYSQTFSENISVWLWILSPFYLSLLALYIPEYKNKALVVTMVKAGLIADLLIVIYSYFMDSGDPNFAVGLILGPIFSLIAIIAVAIAYKLKLVVQNQ